MIRKLRLNFILISMSAVIALLLAIFITINVYMEGVVVDQLDSFLEDVLENGGNIRSPESLDGKEPEQVQLVKGFTLFVSTENQINIISSSDQVPETSIESYSKQILESGIDQGELESYRYQYRQAPNGYLIVFANKTLQNTVLDELLKLSYSIGAISILVLLVFIMVLSKYMTRPVETAFEKQKRFIADSSHELKTPLSVMSANLDLLEMEVGGNQRISAIHDGIKRMNNLIHDLLLLAKTEQQGMTFKEVNLSQVMESTILPLEVVAYEQGNQIETYISENILMKGNEEGIRKMIGALMENAIKYSKKNTPIVASLYKKGDGKIIDIFNEGIGVSKEEKSKLFDKFYRVDSSRHRETGGHGIGLSIVKSVVDLHKGKIHVESDPGKSILFRIILH